MLDTVINAYTEGKTKLSTTGPIPIKEFDSMEADLRPEMRAQLYLHVFFSQQCHD